MTCADNNLLVTGGAGGNTGGGEGVSPGGSSGSTSGAGAGTGTGNGTGAAPSADASTADGTAASSTGNALSSTANAQSVSGGSNAIAPGGSGSFPASGSASPSSGSSFAGVTTIDSKGNTIVATSGPIATGNPSGTGSTGRTPSNTAASDVIKVAAPIAIVLVLLTALIIFFIARRRRHNKYGSPAPSFASRYDVPEGFSAGVAANSSGDRARNYARNFTQNLFGASSAAPSGGAARARWSGESWLVGRPVSQESDGDSLFRPMSQVDGGSPVARPAQAYPYAHHANTNVNPFDALPAGRAGSPHTFTTTTDGDISYHRSSGSELEETDAVSALAGGYASAGTHSARRSRTSIHSTSGLSGEGAYMTASESGHGQEFDPDQWSMIDQGMQGGPNVMRNPSNGSSLGHREMTRTPSLEGMVERLFHETPKQRASAARSPFDDAHAVQQPQQPRMRPPSIVISSVSHDHHSGYSAEVEDSQLSHDSWNPFSGQQGR